MMAKDVFVFASDKQNPCHLQIVHLDELKFGKGRIYQRAEHIKSPNAQIPA
jgi:hypothetical protein